jgi:hypothetical protein
MQPFFALIRNIRRESRLEFRLPTQEEGENFKFDSDSHTLKALIIETS